MDLTTTRTIEINKLAMDGLMERQKAISANTANVMTPGYQRKEVNFENQLKEIIKTEKLKTQLKVQNSLEYNPTSFESVINPQNQGLTLQQQQFLKSNSYTANNFQPQVTDDTISGSAEDGNNVNIEQEVMDMAKTGLRYNTLATLQQKQFQELTGIIKGQ